MPARTALRENAARAVPPGLVLLRGFPEHEIHRIAFVRRYFDPRARQHLVERAARERAIARRAGQRVHRGRREQHVVLGDIGDAARHEALDQRGHLGQIRRRSRLVGRRQTTDRRYVRAILAQRALRDARDRLVERQIRKVQLRPGDDLVVHVGDVAGVDDVGLAVGVAQQAKQQVEDDRRSSVANVGEIVDGGAADIHAHGFGIDRAEGLLRPGQRVIELQSDRHGVLPRSCARADRSRACLEMGKRRREPASRRASGK